MRLPLLNVRAVHLDVRRDSDLPAGIVGRVEGVALVYGVVDAYGTLFKRGCMDKAREKVRAGKIKLFDNHGSSDWYGTRTHIGVVRSLEQRGDQEVMVADLFDTEDGRRAHEYLRAVNASGAETGLSIGFFERGGTWEKRNEEDVYTFSEIELDEISLAPRNAVPGADVTSVRATGQASARLTSESARALLSVVRDSLGDEAFRALTLPMLRAAADEAQSGDDAKPADEAALVQPTDEEDAVALMRARAAAVRSILSMT